MFSKRFFVWVGVGVLSVATIPTFAAPHLARLARKPVAKTTTAGKVANAKPAAKAPPKTATPTKAVTSAETKKAATAQPVKAPAVTARSTPTKKHVALAHKGGKASKATAASKKNIH